MKRAGRIAELKEKISCYEEKAEFCLAEAAKIRGWNEGTEDAEDAIRCWMDDAEKFARIADRARTKLEAELAALEA